MWGHSENTRRVAQTRNQDHRTDRSQYMLPHLKPPSHAWRTFLENHVKSIVSVDFFTVPTIRFQILYVFLVLAHNRRRILQFGSPLIGQRSGRCGNFGTLFRGRVPPRYFLRDLDRIFGEEFVTQVKAMVVKQVLSAPRPPWQRAYVERLIGSLRRQWLDHAVAFSAEFSAPYTHGLLRLLP
jgi:hypothetical protein